MALEEPGLFDAVFRVVHELEELAAAEVAARAAAHGEVVERREVGRGALCAGPRGWARRDRCDGLGRRLAAAKRDLVEDVAMRWRDGRGCGDHAERPRRLGRGRCVAEVRVARLIPKPRGNGDRARRDAAGDRQPNANRKLALEDGERLLLAGLLQVRRRRKDDLVNADAGRRVNGEHGRDEVRVSRFVRLGVKAFGQRDPQRDAHRRATAGAVALDERRHVGLRTRQLRAGGRRDQRESGDEDERTNAH